MPAEDVTLEASFAPSSGSAEVRLLRILPGQILYSIKPSGDEIQLQLRHQLITSSFQINIR